MLLSVCRSVCGHCYATHTLMHKHTLQLGTCTYIHVCDVCVCVCACICVRVVVYIFTLVLVLAIFTPPAHFTRRLWLLFLHYFLHISISGACLQFGIFSSFSFVASRYPARTISKVPLRSNVLDKLNGKERKVKSAQQQQQQPHEHQQESGRVAAAAPIYASFIAPSSVGLRDSLSLFLSLGLLLLCNWLSGTRAVPLSASTH